MPRSRWSTAGDPEDPEYLRHLEDRQFDADVSSREQGEITERVRFGHRPDPDHTEGWADA